MAKKKITHGGKRENSGRKPLTEKRLPVTVYLPESTIKGAGGKEDVKRKIYEEFNIFV